MVFNKTGNQITADSMEPHELQFILITIVCIKMDYRLSLEIEEGKTIRKTGRTFFKAGVPGTGGTDITDVQKAEGYLAHKWGLESSLPSDHPYKSFSSFDAAGEKILF